MDARVSNAFTRIETGFNIAGSIPVLGFYSGILRAIVGKIQFIIGGILTAIGLFGQIIDRENARRWSRLADTGLENVVHGGLNVLRGIVEAAVGTTILGSIGLFAFQAVTSNGFAPRVKYGIFNSRIVVINF